MFTVDEISSHLIHVRIDASNEKDNFFYFVGLK
jgi:hypothetical protein